MSRLFNECGALLSGDKATPESVALSELERQMRDLMFNYLYKYQLRGADIRAFDSWVSNFNTLNLSEYLIRLGTNIHQGKSNERPSL